MKKEIGDKLCLCIVSTFEELPQAREFINSLMPLPDGYLINFLFNGEGHVGLSAELQKLPQLIYKETISRLGDVAARNELLSSETTRSAQAVAFVDPTFSIPLIEIKKLFETLASGPECGIVGPVALTEDGKNSRSQHQSEFSSAGLSKEFSEYFPFSNLFSELTKKRTLNLKKSRYMVAMGDLRFNPKVLGWAKSSRTYEVGAVSEACLMFRTSLIDKIGTFDSGFNEVSFANIDFCLRARQAAFKNYVCSTAKAIKKKISHDAEVLSVLGSPVERSTRDFGYLIKKLRGSPDQSLSELIAGSFILDPESPRVDVYRQLIGWKQLENPNSAVILEPKTRRSRECENIYLQEHDQIYRRNQASRNQELLLRKTRDERRQYLKSFRDKHKGERCFIIGNGPSLNQTDLNLLKNEKTFAVNGIFYKKKDMGFRPSYYVVEDNHVISDNVGEINEMNEGIRFFPERYSEQINSNTKTYFLPVDWDFYDPKSPFFEVPRFSTDISEAVQTGQTVTYMNLQLAYYMGFSEVYLIGVDFSYTIPDSAKIEGHTITSQDNDPNHFHPDYFGKGKKWHDPKLHNCLKSFAKAKEVFEKDGRRIWNATIGGHLDIFERINFYEIFAESSSRAEEKPNVDVESFIRNRKGEEKFVLAESLPQSPQDEAPLLIADFSNKLDTFMNNWASFSGQGWIFWCRQNLCFVTKKIDQSLSEDLADDILPPLPIVTNASSAYLTYLLDNHIKKGRYLKMRNFLEEGKSVAQVLIRKGVPFVVKENVLVLKW